MSCGDDYTPKDAANIMTEFWHEWADTFEAKLFELVDQTEDIEIFEPDDMYLIRKFSKYPDRPAIQPGSSKETQGSLLDRAWHQWAADVEEIFASLKNCLARGKAQPKVDQAVFYTMDEKVSVCPIPSLQQAMNEDLSSTHVSSLLRALLWMAGVRFSASSSLPDKLVEGMEKLCVESGTYSGSGRLSEEMAIRMKKMSL